MKKYKLCNDCDLKKNCSKQCQESIDEELRDNSKNYQEPGAYKPIGTIKLGFPVRMMSELRQDFRDQAEEAANEARDSFYNSGW